MSIWRKQIKPEIIKPQNKKITKNFFIANKFNFQNNKLRTKPYKPNFNKTAANIIEPKTGASTWAFANHKCKPYIGTFTKKHKIQNNIIQSKLE